jgi:hypothetical protein
MTSDSISVVIVLDALLGSSFCTVAVAVDALRVQLAVPQA